MAATVAMPVIDDLNLFFHNRHTTRKPIVFAHFTGQLVHFGLHDGLVFPVGNENTNQRNAAGNDCSDN